MFINGCKTLVIRCRFCGRLRSYDLNLFNLMGHNKIECKCKCGETNILIEKVNSIFKIQANCFNCGNVHLLELGLNQILREENIFHCIHGSELFFIGSEKKANQILLQNEINLDGDINSVYGDDYFNNFRVFGRVLRQLYLLNSRGNINCDCGKSEIQIQLFSDRLELKCTNCNSVKIIFAETEEDLSILMKKDKISLREHNISCIDSIRDKNKDIKK